MFFTNKNERNIPKNSQYFELNWSNFFKAVFLPVKKMNEAFPVTSNLFAVHDTPLRERQRKKITNVNLAFANINFTVAQCFTLFRNKRFMFDEKNTGITFQNLPCRVLL